MLNIEKDIQPLTEFKKHTNEFISDLKKHKRPTILTIRGKAEIVIMDASSFQKMQEMLESRFESDDVIGEINNSLADFSHKKFAPAKKVLSKLQSKINKK